jgi:hypothetical protein
VRGAATESPTARLTIAEGVLTVTPWTPALVGGTFTRAVFAQRKADGVTIADAWIVESGEGHDVIVEFLSDAELSAATDVLTRWASALGYQRLWFDDRVVSLTYEVVPVKASVDCPTCHAHWSETAGDFWHHVEEAGLFPSVCPACGSTLPQWQVIDGFDSGSAEQ